MLEISKALRELERKSKEEREKPKQRLEEARGKPRGKKEEEKPKQRLEESLEERRRRKGSRKEEEERLEESLEERRKRRSHRKASSEFKHARGSRKGGEVYQPKRAFTSPSRYPI
tara:strand:- start:1352 stop:1696 length:345 start_codon:yes stop_codon:yes gene_type:complete